MSNVRLLVLCPSLKLFWCCSSLQIRLSWKDRALTQSGAALVLGQRWPLLHIPHSLLRRHGRFFLPGKTVKFTDILSSKKMDRVHWVMQSTQLILGGGKAIWRRFTVEPDRYCMQLLHWFSRGRLLPRFSWRSSQVTVSWQFCTFENQIHEVLWFFKISNVLFCWS